MYEIFTKKSIKILVGTILIVMGLTSCGSHSSSRKSDGQIGGTPATAQVQKDPEIQKTKQELRPRTDQSPSSEPSVEKPAVKPVEKKKEKLAGNGRVVFEGFDAAALRSFRVIPEDSKSSFFPVDGRSYATDGFWWGGDRTRWFKIPDHCRVVIKPEGVALGTAHGDDLGEPQSFGRQGNWTGFQVWRSCDSFWTSIQAFRGGVQTAGFIEPRGAGSIGVSYPF